ncbi:UDP-glucose 4-epimerase [Halohasta litchfieldiae]|jgi:UDP-glucose 4-epimerase|uniref:UDP-glucose 4-epimerase n=1 Tax=Halohasta litchfieldiae TaxID=1073996 RepID=A0A1H6YFI0_9EURY|nr:GDP-mannose 4,6-dehydratase [Halohasta litchfieldiae]SEJ35952.1 UDP-glucose 4-epimerase [Halohasta litchfieldiae]
MSYITEYNINGSQTILKAARTHDVDRVVNASSLSVYGKPQYLLYDEAHPTEPVSPYGASKLGVEHYMRIYTEVALLKSY